MNDTILQNPLGPNFSMTFCGALKNVMSVPRNLQQRLGLYKVIKENPAHFSSSEIWVRFGVFIINSKTFSLSFWGIPSDMENIGGEYNMHLKNVSDGRNRGFHLYQNSW